MSKNNQKTIADLSVNWTFNWDLDADILAKIQKANPEISHLKIVKNIYRFYVDTWHFPIETSDLTLLSDLIYLIDSTIFNLQESKRLPRVLVLNRFELIAENEFRIHVKET